MKQLQFDWRTGKRRRAPRGKHHGFDYQQARAIVRPELVKKIDPQPATNTAKDVV